MKMKRQQDRESEAIRAYVVLRGRGGVSATDRGPPPSDIERVIALPQTIEQAKKFLQLHGFSIHRVSPTSITVEAPPRQFELTFKASPKKLSHAGKHPFYGWSESPKIPGDLKDVVADVVFPQPAILLDR
jgi:hypothetical protein